MKWKRFLSACRIRNKDNRSQDFSAALFFTKQNALDDIFNQEKRKKEIKKNRKVTVFLYVPNASLLCFIVLKNTK